MRSCSGFWPFFWPGCYTVAKDEMMQTITRSARSLVPRPHPLFNVARRKGEGLVREVTCMIFMWKGGGRVIILRGLVICLRAPCT